IPLNNSTPIDGAGAGGGGIVAQTPGLLDPRTAGDADLGGYGGSPAIVPVAGLMAKKEDPFKGLMSQGMGLLASASPQPQQPPPQMQMPQAQAHRPQQTTEMPNFISPDLQRR